MPVRGKTHVLGIAGTDFRALMREHPDMSERVIQTLVDKLAGLEANHRR